MTALPDLYLMRHGQTVWNAEGRLQGRMDSPLTALGRHQARRQAQLVQGIDAARYASNAGRAVETAGIVYGGRDFRQDARLHEIDIGEFTGRAWADLCAAHPEITIAVCGEHGGNPESIAFCQRAGLDYVSCSPFRVPVARLAAAQESIRNRNGKTA